MTLRVRSGQAGDIGQSLNFVPRYPIRTHVIMGAFSNEQ
jgi:hypothetical protein